MELIAMTLISRTGINIIFHYPLLVYYMTAMVIY